MKIRIVRNSIRFRLNQPEAYAFSQQQRNTEIMEFAMSRRDRLRVVLQAARVDEFAIAFEEYTTTLDVPQQLISNWTATNLLGFEETIKARNGKTINGIVEKNLVWLDKSTEENKGIYPNPKVRC